MVTYALTLPLYTKKGFHKILCFSKLRSHHAVMLLHLCVALTLGHTFFLMGKNENKKLLHVIESEVSFFSIAILMRRDAAVCLPSVRPSVAIVRKQYINANSVDRCLCVTYPWFSEFIFYDFLFFFFHCCPLTRKNIVRYLFKF